MHDCACDRLKEAVGVYNTMYPKSSIGKVRVDACNILMLLAEAVAYMNQTYFRKGLKMQYADLKQFRKQPDEFTILYHDIITENNIDQLKDKCRKIIKNTVCFLKLNCNEVFPQTVKISNKKVNTAPDSNPEKGINYNQAAHWYEELSSTFNKIYICAENGDYILAFISACALQNSLELDLEMNVETTDLLGAFQHDNLERLALKTHEIEAYIINEIEKNNVTIRKINSLDELKQ